MTKTLFAFFTLQYTIEFSRSPDIRYDVITLMANGKYFLEFSQVRSLGCSIIFKSAKVSTLRASLRTAVLVYLFLKPSQQPQEVGTTLFSLQMRKLRF